MASKISVKAIDGSTIEFMDEVIGSSSLKDLCYSPDKSYVVSFYKNELAPETISKLRNLVRIYQDILSSQTGIYWKNLFYWPERIFKWNNRIGVVFPLISQRFYFNEGIIVGKEMTGKWFASAKLKNKFLSTNQQGTWLSYLILCTKIAQAIRFIHSVGLLHADLSYSNLLVNPLTGEINFIVDEELLIPEGCTANIVENPDFIAPERIIMKSLHKYNSSALDVFANRHSLAVLIYMFLLNRHPLRGGKVYDLDPGKDEELAMGEKALFIEHPTDKSNRPKVDQLNPSELPQGDVTRLPYTICGPYLKKLFDKAFIDGLHNPKERPSATEWEEALIKTLDLVLPCQGEKCNSHWFIFDNSSKPKCPFCGKEYKGQLPILNFYYAPSHDKFISENCRLIVHNKQKLYKWHSNNLISPNEKTSNENKKPVGDFHIQNCQWYLFNRGLTDMYDVTEKKPIPVGGYVPLTEGRQIILDKGHGGRLVYVQLLLID